ncbi:MAG: tetratricopeptide repeat protein [Magnetococcales bacterium]|nr:tetratricopeptide repeat protein [Magnetococcales bacterium]
MIHEQLLRQAVAHHRAGRSQEAERLYLEILRTRPDHPDARHNLGVLAMQTGRPHVGLPHLQTALRTAPEVDQYHLSCLDALLQCGLTEEARQLLARWQPSGHPLDSPPQEEMQALVSLYQQRRYAEMECMARDLRDRYFRDGFGWKVLGLALKLQGRLEEAWILLQKAAELLPEDGETANYLGMIRHQQGRWEEAERCYRQALTWLPDYAEGHYNLGITLQDQGRLAEAEAHYRRALALRADYVKPWNNLGNLLKEQARFVEAEEALLQAVGLQPELVDAQWNLALLYLSQGRYQEGWPLHETRHHPDKTDRKTLPIDVPFPMWRGEDLTGRTLLLTQEQGLGDQIQFFRYVSRLKAMGVKRITLVCLAPLEALFAAQPEVDQVLVKETLQNYPQHDYWSFLLSLPLRLGTTPETIPATLPYLRAPMDRLSRWGDLVPGRGFRVGLVWKGNPKHSNDAHRSLPGLLPLVPLGSVPGVVLISLQKENGEEASHPPPGLTLLNPGAAIGDCADTAALVAHLDLVISVDSAVAHLAGAMGKPCWVMLSAVGTDWRWLHDRADSPWYPGCMRLFRQGAPEEWSEVVERMASALERWVS